MYEYVLRFEVLVFYILKVYILKGCRETSKPSPGRHLTSHSRLPGKILFEVTFCQRRKNEAALIAVWVDVVARS